LLLFVVVVVVVVVVIVIVVVVIVVVIVIVILLTEYNILINTWCHQHVQVLGNIHHPFYACGHHVVAIPHQRDQSAYQHSIP